MTTFNSNHAGGMYRAQAPSSRTSSSSSDTFDYSGLERHLKMQDELANASHDKYQRIYKGDVPGSVDSQHRIRDLLTQLRVNAPGTTERDPYQVFDPLVKVAHSSSDSSQSFEGGGVEQAVPDYGSVPSAGDRHGNDNRMDDMLADQERQRQQIRRAQEKEAAKRGAGFGA